MNLFRSEEHVDRWLGDRPAGRTIEVTTLSDLAHAWWDDRLSAEWRPHPVDRIQAILDLRSFLFEAVYENSLATVEFKKATGILSGLWEKVRENPAEFLDMKTVDAEGLDAAARDFIAGMTDRYAVRLFEQLYIPKPWAIE